MCVGLAISTFDFFDEKNASAPTNKVYLTLLSTAVSIKNVRIVGLAGLWPSASERGLKDVCAVTVTAKKFNFQGSPFVFF